MLAIVALTSVRCSPPSQRPAGVNTWQASTVRISRLRDLALTRGPLSPIDAARGIRLLYDVPVPARPSLAVTRSIVRSNPRLSPVLALELATRAVGEAHASGLPYGFYCATLLQESAFEPDARSSAGAIGIAQFTIETADAYGIDPLDWRDAMRGAARLLARYVDDYRPRYDDDPYEIALAAYNAGPGAVEKYGGVPPYRETREYIRDVYDRWSRIAWDARR